MNVLQLNKDLGQLNLHKDCISSPVASYNIQQAHLHRQQGLNLGSLMVLYKYCRRSYIDLVNQTDFTPNYRQRCHLQLEHYFDCLEIGICTTWCAADSSAAPWVTGINEELVVVNEELLATEEELRQQIEELHQSREEFAALNQRLNDIIEFLPDATFVVDRERKVIAWNKAMEEMTGVAKKDILGRGNYAYAVPFYGKLRPGLVDLVFENSPVEQFYNNFQIKERVLYSESFVPMIRGGQGAHVWLKASPFFDKQGNIVGAIESVRDITEQKQAEQTIKKYQLLSEHAQDIILFVKRNGAIIEANQAAVNAYGYSREKLLQMSIFDLRCCDSATTEKQLQQAYQQGIRFEAEHRRRDGTIFPVEVHSLGLTIDKEQILMSVIRDITERKAAAESLLKEKERLAVTLKSIGEGVVTTDTVGNITMMNRVAEKLTGYTQKEAQGQPLSSIIQILDEKTRQRWDDIVQYIVRNKHIINLDNRSILMAKDGTEKSIVSSGAPIYTIG